MIIFITVLKNSRKSPCVVKDLWLFLIDSNCCLCTNVHGVDGKTQLPKVLKQIFLLR